MILKSEVIFKYDASFKHQVTNTRWSRRLRLATLAAIVVSSQAFSVVRAEPVVPRHVVALAGGNSGRMLFIDWIEPAGTSVEMGDIYSFKFCNTDECQVVEGAALSVYQATTYVEPLATATVPVSMGSQLITVKVARGSNPSNDDWSSPSRAVLPSEPAQLPEDPTLPQLDVMILQQGQQYIDFGFCFNRTDDTQLVRSGNDLVFHAVRPRATYQVSLASQVVSSGTFGMSYVDAAWWHMCEETYADQVRVQDLQPGATYRIEVRLETENHAPLTATKDFTTPGGCPLEAPQYVSPGLPWGHAVIDSDNRFVHHLGWAFSKRSARNRGVAPTYTSAGKTFPGSGAYEYLPEIDDWALHLEEASAIGKTELIKRTVFKDCAPEEVDILVTTVNNPIRGEEQESSCQVIEGVAIPTRIGECFLRIVASRRVVTEQGSAVSTRSARSTQTLLLPLVIDSVGATPSTQRPLEGTTPGKTAGSTDQALPITGGAAKLVDSVLARRVGSKLSWTSIIRRSGIKPATSAKSTLKVSRESRKICRLRSNKVELLAAGSCRLTLTVSQTNRRNYSKVLSVTALPR
jgi:hypothetical protein